MDGSETEGTELRRLGSGSSTGAASSQAVSQGGRPSKITPEVTKRICAALSAGATRKDAALTGGVVYETFRRWMNKGEEECLAAMDADNVLGSVPPPDSGAYVFYMAVLQAEASVNIRLSMVLYKAALDDPWVALACLERRRRAEWGLRIDIRKVPTEVLVEMLKEQFIVEDLEGI